ncbi:blue-light-activated protein [Mariprofundus micogutta]|uniref:histidine kinase n=1 Tax=Mariprofundus micogutta TaxID=1921010 RepID=A0A1L8CN69_9PROT|nr:PAS domain S-box protein [Mariprofundus micogutta]GAV20343.1 blue-light-activated protein [Mariprofundus micogutta]
MTLKVADILTRNLVTVSPETMLDEATRLMSDNRISCLIAVSEKKPVGILTESDLVHVCRLGVDTAASPVSDFMANPVISTLTNMNVFEVYDLFLEKNMRHLVVVNQDEELDGLVTLSDILKATEFDDFLHAKQVRDVMRAPIVCVSVDQSVQAALEKMDAIHISCVVVTEKEKAVGIFTERDAARLLAAKQHAKQLNIAEVMTSPLLTLKPEDPLILASTTMRELGTRRLVIVDSSDQPVGIVTQFDVVRGLEGVSIRHFKDLYTKSEQKLEENNKLLEEKSELERIVAASPGVLYRCVWDNTQARSEFKPTYFSSQIRSMLGYEPSDFLRPDWWEEYVHPDDQASVQKCLHSIIISGEQNLTYRVKTKTNDYIWVLDHARVSKDADGKPVEMVGSWLDISERRQAEEEVSKSEEKYRRMIESSNDAIFVAEIETGILIDANEQAEEMLGLPREKIIGMHQAELHPPEEAERYRQIFADHIHDDRAFIPDLLVRRADGTDVPVDISSNIVDVGGRIVIQGVFRNITERKRADLAVAESEAKYRSLFDDAEDLIHITDAEGVIVDVNRAELDCLGYSQGEMLGKSVLDFVAPDYRDSCIHAVGTVLHGEPFSNYETVFLTKEGEPVWLEISAVPQFDAEGNVSGARAIMRDITGRKQAEKVLHDSESRLVASQVISHTGTWDWNPVTGDLIWSDETYRIHGYEPGQVEPSYELFLKHVHPDDRDMLASAVETALNENQPYSLDCRLQTVDGKEMVCHAQGEVEFDTDGQPLRMLGVFQDITERKQAESETKESRQRLENVLAAVPESIFMKDMEGRYVFCNDMVEQVFGKSQDEIIGHTDFDLVSKQQAEAFRENDRLAMEADKPRINEETVVFGSDGHEELLQTIKIAIRDEAGEVIGMLGVGRNITDTRKAEQAYRNEARRNELILQTSMDGFILADVQGQLVDVNPAYCDMVGYSRDELLGMNIVQMEAWLTPEQVGEKIGRMMQDGSARFESQHRHKDGHVIDLDVSIFVMQQEGQKPLVSAFVRDISDRKMAAEMLTASELKFRSLFEESRDMMHIVGRDGCVIDVNRAELETLGYTREEMIGKPLKALVCPEYHDITMPKFAELMQGKPIPIYESAMHAKDGTCIHVEVTATPQFDNDGNVVASRAIIRDIRSRKQKEALLARRERQLAVLAEAGSEINEQLEVVEIGRRLVELACRLVDCESGAVGFYRDEKICFREYLKQGKRMEIELDFPGGYGVPGHVLETRAPYISADAPNNAHVIPEIQQSLGFMKLIDVPILNAQGELLGCFEMHDRNDGADFDEQDLEMLQSLAGIVGAALINARQQTEIKQEAVRMKLILDAEFDAIVVQQNEKVVFSNKNAQTLFGYDSLEETIGENAMLAFLPEQRSFASRVVRRSIRRNEPTGRIEMMGVSRARSEPFPMEIASVPIEWAGKPAVVSVVRDITERKTAQKQIESERAAMRAILNNLPFLAWLKDEEGRFLAVNDLFVKACGAADAASLADKTDLDLWPEELAIAYRLDDQDVMDSGKAKQVEEQVEVEGDKRWFETFKSPVFDAEGKVVGTAGMARDITEKINSEAQMRLLESAVGSVNESIIITDAEGVIEYVNPGFTRNTGFTFEDAIGNTPAMLNSKQQKKGFYEQFWQTIKSGQAWSGRILDRKKDGTIFPVHLSVAPIVNTHGQISHFVAVHEDLTEAEAMQKKMMQSQKMEAVATMVGGVAHDFNNLLASIVGNLYLMRNQHKDNEKTVSRIRGMESAVQHGAQLIQQMLTFARKDRTDMQGMDLKVFAKESFKMAQAGIPENIKFRLDYAAENELWVKGDATQLQQVLLNLVANARHAVRHAEQPEISMDLYKVPSGSAIIAEHSELSSENGWCCLTCTDNGEGIQAKHLQRVFEPFFTTKAVGEGTGLGLAMVYGAVQNHRGIIDVQSAPGEGTCISIYLPLYKAAPVQIDEDDESEVDGSGICILIVDDEENLRQVLADVLRHNAFRILQACDGEQAIEMFVERRDEIDLILMDVVMPVKGGVVAAGEIREIDANIPIIFQTGYGEQTQLEAAASINNSASLQKPVLIPQLMQLILEQVEGGRRKNGKRD